ncbi:type II toxin-antitoxin system VapC family toxin [Azospirillum rugosum]|uniref:Ribonuclease VapC n=1 Tax=Azospirillum rugosum TaxID=416170 RepID=A0ABS4SCX7_9PROT|nr:type II toxin-antitoxin system VapC family toxin [Azospirillum rugosum]MBP2290428.1 putative nucleic acid-binding protein [Azospirillum rugosum]MDQ0527904.1 putative nucleic acid-binding protein [Azospirillum rugosum]
MTVVDASVAIRWSIKDSFTPAAQAIIESGQPIVAPDLVIPEVANALWKMRRAGAIGAEQADQALEEIPRGFSRLVGTTSLMRRAYSIAESLDHPVYDCFYLALSENLGVPLITLDKRLHARTRSTRWAGFTVLLGSENNP